MDMTTAGHAQERALDDARVRWHEAIAAIDMAQAEADNLNDASPQLLADDLYWKALGAFGEVTDMLSDLIAAADDEVHP